MRRTRHGQDKLPSRFEELVGPIPPQAIADDVQLDHTTAVIDRLMTIPRPTKGQAVYLETLTQLVVVCESDRHAIDTAGVSGLDSLKYLLNENQMTGADLAKLLGVHVSMGLKILKGDRQLTADHLRKLTERFHVGASLFL